MKLAVLKPDHFGDLLLSSAAIRAVLAGYPDAAIFVCGANLKLARSLFGPATDLRRADFPHLAKPGTAAQAAPPDLSGFDLVLSLRLDSVINERWALDHCRDFLLPVETRMDHQSIVDYAVVSRLLGAYDIDTLHFGNARSAIAAKAAQAARSIGLCIGSGFHANVWPLTHWIDLGRILQRADCRVSLIHGPQERAAAGVIGRALNLRPQDVIAGGDSIADTRMRLDALDWIVGSDGGTAHLCALHAPVLSIFGPSPFRRYAPYGIWNRLLTQELECSPCCQWAQRLLNGCLSAECMAGIAPTTAHAALVQPGLRHADPGGLDFAPGTRLHTGVSHIDIASKIAARVDFFVPSPVPRAA